jgi:hypothetical protein
MTRRVKSERAPALCHDTRQRLIRLSARCQPKATVASVRGASAAITSSFSITMFM